MSLVFAHPTYQKVLKLLEKTAGRDKLLRVIQYFARFFGYVLLKRGYSKQSVEFWNTLKAQLALSRKLFRVGKPLGFYKNAASAYSQKTTDSILRFTSIWRNIFQGSYLLLDSIVWLHKSKVRQLEKSRFQFISDSSYKFWAAALICGIVNNAYKLNIARKTRQALLAEKEQDVTHLKAAVQKEKTQLKLLAWDILDLTVPISGLGYTGILDDGNVGLAGLITSYWGLQEVWDKL